MNPPPPPPPPPCSSYKSFPILAISIVGILTTAIILLSYYLFVVKCRLNWRLPRHLLLFRSRRFLRRRFLHPPPNTNQQTHRPTGLDSTTINSIPTLRFSKPTTSSSSSECAVCLADFRQHDLLRLLPSCSHSFHIDCIDTWLQFNSNCPLCRADITSPPAPPIHPFFGVAPPAESHDSTAEARESGASEQQTTPTTPKSRRRFWQMASMGDECIDIRDKDERFAVVQPIRRSFSMDSSNDRQLCVSVQEILRQNPSLFRDGEGSSSGGASARIRRSFFSFGRSGRSAASVLPVQWE